MPWWLVPSSPTSPARSMPMTTGGVVLADVVDDLVEGALEERRVQRDEGPLAGQREAGRQRHRVLLGDAHVEDARREAACEACDAGAGGHARGDGHDSLVLACRCAIELAAMTCRVAGRLRAGGRACADRSGVASPSLACAPCRWRRRRRSGAAGHARHGRQGGAVEADLVGLRGPVAAALARADVDEDRAVLPRSARRSVRVERHEVVAGHRADVGDAEVLEEPARLGELDDRHAQTRRDHSRSVGPDDAGRARRCRRRRAASRATCARA